MALCWDRTGEVWLIQMRVWILFIYFLEKESSSLCIVVCVCVCERQIYRIVFVLRFCFLNA